MLETERVYHSAFFLFFRLQIFGSFQRRIFPFIIHQSRYSLEVLCIEYNDLQEVYQISKNNPHSPPSFPLPYILIYLSFSENKVADYHTASYTHD